MAGEVSDLAKEEQELNSPERGRGDRPTDRTTDRARGEHGKINSEKIGRHGQERGWRAAAEEAAVLPEREPCSSCISFQHYTALITNSGSCGGDRIISRTDGRRTRIADMTSIRIILSLR